jgi:ABC-2 type transport system permease protein
VNVAVNRLWTLIQREIWEHRGGFVYTPLIVGGVLVILFLMGGGSTFFWTAKFTGSDQMAKATLKLAEVNVTQEQLNIAVQMFFWGTALLWQAVMFIVLVFYCIGCLFDDRRDRSVLFWKSMPVSDLETVGSKVLTAVVVAPLCMFVGLAIGQIVLLLLTGILIAIHGGNPWSLVWSHANPVIMWLQFLAVQGVQALFLLPLIGWLMLAGAFARGKPFLWATLPPVMLAIIESWLRFTSDFSVSRVVWEFILRRLASGVAPITIKADFGSTQMQAGLADSRFAANFGDVMARLGSADLWIGVGVGAAFLAAAVYVRRYRDDSTS